MVRWRWRFVAFALVVLAGCSGSPITGPPGWTRPDSARVQHAVGLDVVWPGGSPFLAERTHRVARLDAA